MTEPEKSTRVTKAAAKRKAAPRRKTAAHEEAERELQWAKWQSRTQSLVLMVVCLLAIANEFFIEREPRPTVLVAAATFLGVPLILAGTRGKDE